MVLTSQGTLLPEPMPCYKAPCRVPSRGLEPTWVADLDVAPRPDDRRGQHRQPYTVTKATNKERVMPHLTRDGVQIYYEDHGQGIPILLSHGFGASTGMWQGQIEAFRDTYRLIPWDMRGHGNSDSPEDQALYSHAHTIEDMRAILDHLRIDQAVIAGHSLGGFMSLAFYVEHPERVKALVLQGCGPGYRNPEARAAWNARTEERARRLEEQGLAALGGGSEVRISTQHAAAGLARAARGILAQRDARVIEILPRISVPVLILVGAGDAPFLNGSNYMASRLQHVTKVIIPDAGHGANVDQPDLVNRLLRHFLAQFASG
jgi:pimeloyl-ACP methyl ester carboxylesterase